MRGLPIVVFLVSVVGAQPPVTSRPFRLEEIKTLPGFAVTVHARVPGGPRLMAIGPNGVLYVAARDAGSVYAVPEANKPVVALQGLNGPHSVDFRGNDLFVAVNDGLLRFSDAITPDLAVRSQPERLFTLPSRGGHSTRTMHFGPDGRMYATAGSSCNFCVETDQRRAAMMRYETDGTAETVFARGLRNSVDFAWHPQTGDLWALDNGGDGLGENEPSDEIDNIRQGSDYGWPDCIGQACPANWGTQARPARCPSTAGPEWEIQAHSAPLGIAFYTGAQWPASFLNDALVGLHGSWNRNEPTGYKVIRVRAAGGQATASEDFLWGFLDVANRTASGRPVGVVVAPDGALFVSDDYTGNIYRVSYAGPRINPEGIVARGGGVYELYGSHLMNDPALVSVDVGGAPAQILYAAPGQINFAIAGSAPAGLPVTVRNEKASDTAPLP